MDSRLGAEDSGGNDGFGSPYGLGMGEGEARGVGVNHSRGCGIMCAWPEMMQRCASFCWWCTGRC